MNTQNEIIEDAMWGTLTAMIENKLPIKVILFIDERWNGIFPERVIEQFTDDTMIFDISDGTLRYASLVKWENDPNEEAIFMGTLFGEETVEFQLTKWDIIGLIDFKIAQPFMMRIGSIGYRPINKDMSIKEESIVTKEQEALSRSKLKLAREI